MTVPDVEIKPQKYRDERPREHFAHYHARARPRARGSVYEIVRIVTVLNALITYRARSIDSENVPIGPVDLRPWRRLRSAAAVTTRRRYGPPFRFEAVADSTRGQQQEVANVVLERIGEMHTELAQLGSRTALRAARRHALA